MALPHTLLIPEGSRGGAKSAKSASVGREVLCIKEGQNAVRFSCLVFCRWNANWEKHKMLSIFPFQFSMRKCRYGIAVMPERQAGTQASRVKTAELVAPLPSVASASA